VSEPFPPRGDRQADGSQSIAQAISEVSERASLLVREEIELAKAELSEKTTKLVKGAVVGVAAGVFLVIALIFVLVGCAWLIYFYLPVGDFAYFWGFFAMAVILVLLGLIAGFIAARAVKRATPPVPTMAIEEARRIREDGQPRPGAARRGARTAARRRHGEPELMAQRSAAEIRSSIESNRTELAVSVDRLRGEVARITRLARSGATASQRTDGRRRRGRPDRRRSPAAPPAQELIGAWRPATAGAVPPAC